MSPKLSPSGSMISLMKLTRCTPQELANPTPFQGGLPESADNCPLDWVNPYNSDSMLLRDPCRLVTISNDSGKSPAAVGLLSKYVDEFADNLY
jgi:hypothetical protein